MIKTNFLCLLYHILLLIPNLYLMMNNPPFIFFIVIPFCTLIAYYLIGKAMYPQDNRFLNFVAVSSIWIVGLILWIIILILRRQEFDPLFLLILIYSNSLGLVYLFTFLPIPETDAAVITISFLIVFIPTILLWMGLNRSLSLMTDNSSKLVEARLERGKHET